MYQISDYEIENQLMERRVLMDMYKRDMYSHGLTPIPEEWPDDAEMPLITFRFDGNVNHITYFTAKYVYEEMYGGKFNDKFNEFEEKIYAHELGVALRLPGLHIVGPTKSYYSDPWMDGDRW